MKAFLDTSVLVTTFYADHQFHQPSIDLFLRFKKSESSCGAHSLAEISHWPSEPGTRQWRRGVAVFG